jgi:hypothetical protein
MSWSDFTSAFNTSAAEYEAIVGASDPDLSRFKKRGGKMVHWHGLSDQLIFPEGSEKYYLEAEKQDPSVRDFYRFFQAPGVTHCGFGAGASPDYPNDAVVAWVEKCRAPDTLPGVSVDGSLTRNLCPYSLMPTYRGGDYKKASSFQCKQPPRRTTGILGLLVYHRK